MRCVLSAGSACCARTRTPREVTLTVRASRGVCRYRQHAAPALSKQRWSRSTCAREKRDDGWRHVETKAGDAGALSEKLDSRCLAQCEGAIIDRGELFL